MLYGKYVANRTVDLNSTVKQLGLDDAQPFQEVEESPTPLVQPFQKFGAASV